MFEAQQNYMYAVFERTMLTDTGKTFVRKFESTANAQAIYKAMMEYSQESAQANIDSSTILRYVASARIGDGSWRGTSRAFVLNWMDQIRLYEKLIDPRDHLQDGIKLVMLQNAVHDSKPLRDVKDTAIQLEAVSKVKTTYQEYTNLLLAKCSTIDTDLSVKSSRTPRRSVYHTDIDTADDEVASIEGLDDFGIDCDAHTLLANAHQSYGVHATRMSGKTWHKLSPTAQGIWDQLDDESKALILGRPPDSKRSGTFSHGKPGQKGPSRGTNKINLHDISAHDLLANYHQHQAHQTNISNDDAEVVLTDENVAHTTDDPPSPLLAFLMSRGDNALPGDLRNVLSSTSSRAAKSKPTQQRQANFANLMYDVGKHRTTHRGALIDRGANGGIIGDDARIIAETNRVVNVQGIRDHQVTDLKIVSAGGVVDSQHGPVIAILHQYAHMGSGKSIHSSIQLEAFGLEVNDKSCKVTGGRQRIVTPDGFVHPLQIKDGLAYLSMRPFTDKEWETLPHVHWTQDKDWDPSVLDHALGDHDEEWFDAVTDITELPNKHLFDEFGNYRRCTATVENHIIEPYSDLSIAINARNVQAQEPDYIALRPHFGYTSGDVVKRTFQATTQLGRLSSATHLKWQYRSPNRALNVHRRDEPVTTDTVYADTPAIDDGSTCAQLFFGTKTYVTEVYGMKTDRQFINALEDTIRFHGAMDKLVSDRAQVEISNRVQDILRAYGIASWQSEPHQQHQNPAERRYQTVKRFTNTILNRTSAPEFTWLLCVQYVCYVWNRMACEPLHWRMPLERLTGSTPDISPLLRFTFWEPVYCRLEDADFPSANTEGRGHWVGIADHVGHAMTYKILTNDTSKVIYRSSLRPAMSPMDRNKRADLLDGEELTPTLKSPDGERSQAKPLPVFDPSELIGWTFLMQHKGDGEPATAKIIREITERDTKLADQPERKRFLASVNDDEFQEVVTYNEILDHIAQQEEAKEPTDLWWFVRISGHQGPLKSVDKDYNGSPYNVRVEWANGETTYEPLSIIAADDPVSCAIYTKKNGLLDTPGWRRFKTLAKRDQHRIQMANKAKLKSYSCTPRFKFGFQIPHDHVEAMLLDRKNGNAKWAKAEAQEMESFQEFGVFKDLGKGVKPPEGYKKVKLITVYDVKHDG